jgi:translocation and assembly module TamA
MRLPVRLLTTVLLLMAGQAARAQEEVPYTVEVTGIEDSDLTRKVEQASRLVTLADEPPPSLVALRRRAETDIDRVREVLRSEGYYDGEASTALDESRRPVAVTLSVSPGPAYTLQSFDINLHTPPGSVPPVPVPLDRLGVDLDERARAQPVVKAQDVLLKALAEQGYPLAKVGERRVVVDHATRTMRVELDVDSGPLARFGPVTVSGLERLDEAWVRNRIPWRPGDRFAVDQLEKLRQRLVASGLFSSVKLSTADHVEDDNLLPLTIAVAERDRRSIGFGASWSSTEGGGGNAFWEHRNLFGGAEHLRLSLVASQIRNALDAQYRSPDLGMPDQDSLTTARVEELRTKAFVTRTAGIQSGLEWLLSPVWRASAAGAVERTMESQQDRTRYFTLVSIPLEARRDTSDDILDPMRGNRLVMNVRPFPELLGSTVGFNRVEVYDSQYLKVFDQPRVVLAGWGRLGTIQGAKATDIPADKRFYVGGSGSVRAYGYQMAGPLDASNDPIGGASALAFGAEIRIKASETIGVVPFVEGGGAYGTPWPDLTKRVFWGAGLGLRYFTPIGPVRADVAVPLDRRPGIDDPFQVYLSLGQAF